jgi:hypothetical protein
MRLVHSSLTLETTDEGVELVSRTGEMRLTVGQLEWLCMIGGPAALNELRPPRPLFPLVDHAATAEDGG